MWKKIISEIQLFFQSLTLELLFLILTHFGKKYIPLKLWSFGISQFATDVPWENSVVYAQLVGFKPGSFRFGMEQLNHQCLLTPLLLNYSSPCKHYIAQIVRYNMLDKLKLSLILNSVTTKGYMRTRCYACKPSFFRKNLTLTHM